MKFPPKYREKICLVAIVKNEEHFLKEWLIYHRIIGVDMVFLYDDDPGSPLKSLPNSYDQFVTVIRWWNINKSKSKHGNQLAAYSHAFQNYATSFDWVFFLDVDEFVVLRQHDTLQEFLETCDQASAVSFNWHIFGHNGFVEDPGGLVTSHLTKRQTAVSAEIKTISRVKDIAAIRSPHFCELKSGDRVDAGNKPFSDEIYSGKTDIAHINHYKCRSYKNWMGRVLRGDVNFDNFQDPREHHWRLDTQRCFEQFISKVALCYNECEDLFMLRFRLAILDGIRDAEASPDSLWSGKLAGKLYEQLSIVIDCLKHNLKVINASNDPRPKILLALLMLDRNRLSKDPKDEETAEQLLQDVTENLTEATLRDHPAALNAFGIAMELIAQQRLADFDTNILLDELDDLILDIIYYKEPTSPTPNNLLWKHLTYFLVRLCNHLNVPSEFDIERYHERVSAVKEAARILLNKITQQGIDPCGQSALLKALIILDARELVRLTDNTISYFDYYGSDLNNHGTQNTMNQQQWLMMTLLSILDKENDPLDITIPPDIYTFFIINPEIPESMASTAITWSILLKMVSHDIRYSDLAENIIEKNIGSITARLAYLASPQNVVDNTALEEIGRWGAVLLGAYIQRKECFWLSIDIAIR